MKRLIRSAQAVCFDVDSTVIRYEGIDKLAEFKGVGNEVADLTKRFVSEKKIFMRLILFVRAMGGQVLFQDALKARLDIIKPTQNDMSDFLEKHPIQLTEGVERLIEKLHEQNILVYLVSGGFRQVVKIFF